jgi:hypothetical protein
MVFAIKYGANEEMDDLWFRGTCLESPRSRKKICQWLNDLPMCAYFRKPPYWMYLDVIEQWVFVIKWVLGPPSFVSNSRKAGKCHGWFLELKEFHLSTKRRKTAGIQRRSWFLSQSILEWHQITEIHINTLYSVLYMNLPLTSVTLPLHFCSGCQFSIS